MIEHIYGLTKIEEPTTTKYRVLRSSFLDNINQEVNQALQQGYYLVGGISVVYTPEGIKYFQAVAKDVK